MSKPVMLRHSTVEDSENIHQLMEAVYGSAPHWIEYRQWRHIDNPAGRSIEWVAVTPDGQIVANSSLMRVSMTVGGKTTKASMPTCAATHPAFQRQGIFFKVAGKVAEEAMKEGISFRYAVPNKLSYAWRKKYNLDVKISSRTPMYRPLNVRHVINRYFSNRFVLRLVENLVNIALNLFYRPVKPSDKKDYSINEITFFDSRFDDFWDRISPSFDIAVIRSSKYLNNQYVNVKIPGKEYKIYAVERDRNIFGYIVLGQSETSGMKIGKILDVLAYPDHKEVINLLIQQAVDFFQKQGRDIISYTSIADKGIWKYFRKNGFIKNPFKPKKSFGLIANSSSPQTRKPLECLADPKRWYIQIGDLDYL